MRLKYICSVGLLAFIMMSCHTGKNTLGYFNEVIASGEGTIVSPENSIRLEPEDELRIIVTSIVPAASAQFNSVFPLEAAKGKMEATGTPRMMTYKVDHNGNIDFPGIGTIHVAGMTTMELKAELTEKIGKMVKDPLVTVDLVNFKVNVLGEVNAPQMVAVETERYTILDALAACGDITPYGERENVLVMRTRDDGVIEYAVLDLRDASVVKSPYFQLKQNDVVYVRPNKLKSDNSKYNQNNGFKLSVISTIVSVASVVASVVIALLIK